MCGIAGIFSSGREISGSDIRQMCDILKHRGPDDEGYLFYRPKPKSLSLLHGSDSALREGADITNIGPVKDALLLGHRRLSIIDLSVAGHQPMLYGGNELAIIFNGEIYNYVELKEELIRKGHKFRTHTDTEVVLASYAEWGDRCLEKLNGMWSFVILDTKRNILFGARDRLGVKPFYYFNDNGIFAFASEIKALISLPFVGRQINEENLYDYLMWGDPENVHSTFFKSIYKLPHSNFFTFDLSSGNFTIEKYYELKYNKSLGIFKKEEYEHHCGNVRKIFFKAIDIRLRADVPVGSCLSGGIDSASIVTVISEILKAKNLSQVGDMQKVFTASFEGMPIDETKYACAVAGKTNSIWSRVSPASGELWEDLEKLVYMQDEPFNSTSVYAQYRVMKLAAENRVKVVLDGQGGDELFTGYAPYYASLWYDLVKNYRWGAIMKEARSLKNSPVNVRDIITTISKRLFAKISPGFLITAMKTLTQPESRYIDRDLAHAFHGRDVLAKELSSFSINEESYKLINNGHLQKLLKYEDRNSMANSIESRTPFSDDKELMEYLFSLPSIYKIHNGWSKSLLRDSMRGLLPESIVARTDKLGFEIPECKWLAELKDKFKPLFKEADPHIDTCSIYDDFDGLMSGISPSRGSVLWRFINVMIWKKVFKLN